jgi:hypothetical protein
VGAAAVGIFQEDFMMGSFGRMAMTTALGFGAVTIVAALACNGKGDDENGAAPNSTVTSSPPTCPPPVSGGALDSGMGMAKDLPQGANIDPAAVAAATGVATPEVLGNVVKVSFPRTDIPIEVDGIPSLPAFVGTSGYASFVPSLLMPGDPPGTVAVMGDLILFEDEVNPTMSAALANGLDVTALHNHFFFDKPHVYFMHIAGMGAVDVLGKGVKAALDAQKAVRAQAATPAESFGAPDLVMPSQITAAPLDATFGVTGATKTGMYKASFSRTATSSMCNGCKIGAAMGMYTWAGLAGQDDNAMIYGDFAVTEPELQPVLKSLRGSGINIVSIHHHMATETPRIIFLHYWGRGAAGALATKIKTAVELTAWDGHK